MTIHTLRVRARTHARNEVKYVIEEIELRQLVFDKTIYRARLRCFLERAFPRARPKTEILSKKQLPNNS